LQSAGKLCPAKLPTGLIGGFVTDEERERLMRRPRPGDFAVVDTGRRAPRLIQLGKRLSRGGFMMFDHAVICSRVRGGTIYIVEAMPSGAKENVWHYDDHDHLWSTGVVKTSTKAGMAALAYVGRRYSWLDYAAIAAHAWHLWTPGMRHFVRSTKHLIGSQLVDRAQLDAGIHLFNDRRWRGYVRPSDLADLILEISDLTPEPNAFVARSRIPVKNREIGSGPRPGARSRRGSAGGRQSQRTSAR
jgi:hypothetical protein